MSASYRRLRSLVHPPGSRVTQNSKISQFNTGGRGRGGCGSGRGYGGIGCGRGYVCGHGGLGGRGGRIYGHNPYTFSRRYIAFVAEARVYPAYQWRLLSLQPKNNIKEMKICEEWRGFVVPPACYKLDNEGKLVVDQSFVHNLKSRIRQVSASGNSLVPMPLPPSVPLPITLFVTTDTSTTGQYFGRQCTRQQRSDNSVYSVSINGMAYNGPVCYDKVNHLT